MNNRVDEIFTKGLLAGYAGGKIKNVERAGFQGKASHPTLSKGNVYHDEWFANTNGGGQELIEINGQSFTRLYAGGVPEQTVLDSLKITDKDVGNYLKSKIIELEAKTRLFENCKPEPDGDWQYAYTITSNDPTIRLTTGMESINYKNTPVHLHAFILSLIV